MRTIAMSLALLPLLACAQVQEKRNADALRTAQQLEAVQVVHEDHAAQAPCACKQRQAANAPCPCKEQHAEHKCPGMQRKAAHECRSMQQHGGQGQGEAAQQDAAQAQHAHTNPAATQLAADPAGAAPRWVADAPLREGMARVRTAADALAHLEMGHLGAPQVTDQANQIRAAVDFMFARCRLAPEPDAALHPLLAQLIGISQSLKDHPADPAPLADLRVVLARYAQLFDESAASPSLE